MTEELNLTPTAMPGETFDQYVDRWAAIKRQAKRLAEAEMGMRLAIRESVKQHVGSAWKEGANNLPMSDGRKLTVTHKVNRSLDQSLLPVVRERYNLLNDRPVAFDDLVKVSYDLVVGPYRKLDGEAAQVFSDLVTSKDGAPEVKVGD